MPDGISIKITGLRGTRDSLRRVHALAKEIVKRRRKEIESIVYIAYKRQFESNGAAFGNTWRALKPSTIERKRGMESPSKPLVRTGRLRTSLTGGGRKGRRVLQRGQKLTITNTLPAEAGGSLIGSIESDGRRVVHPVTGIGPRGVRELERLWERIADEIVDRLAT
jgi:hypothetical protein